MNIIDKDFITKQVRSINYSEKIIRNVKSGEKSGSPSALPVKAKAGDSPKSIILKCFVRYNRQMSENILARDILTRIKNDITEETKGPDSLKMLSDALKDLPDKTRKTFSGHLESVKLKSVDDIIVYFNAEFKRLNNIMQNIDSLQGNLTQNPALLLKEIENEIRKGNTGRFTINADSAVKLLNA